MVQLIKIRNLKSYEIGQDFPLTNKIDYKANNKELTESERKQPATAYRFGNKNE